MMGIIKEGREIMAEEYDPEALDAAIISAAQRVEHNEIAAYGTVRTWAELLGEKEASSLLQETLDEEKATDQSSMNSRRRSTSRPCALRPAKKSLRAAGPVDLEPEPP